MPMTISMDDDLKREFGEVCKEIGLTPSAAINVFAKAVVRQGGIPFEVAVMTARERAAKEYHERLCRQLEGAMREVEEGNTYTREEVCAAHEGYMQMQEQDREQVAS